MPRRALKRRFAYRALPQRLTRIGASTERTGTILNVRLRARMRRSVTRMCVFTHRRKLRPRIHAPQRAANLRWLVSRVLSKEKRRRARRRRVHLQLEDGPREEPSRGAGPAEEAAARPEPSSALVRFADRMDVADVCQDCASRLSAGRLPLVSLTTRARTSAQQRRRPHGSRPCDLEASFERPSARERIRRAVGVTQSRDATMPHDLRARCESTSRPRLAARHLPQSAGAAFDKGLGTLPRSSPDDPPGSGTRSRRVPMKNCSASVSNLLIAR
jgi:hypothetical protein